MKPNGYFVVEWRKDVVVEKFYSIKQIELVIVVVVGLFFSFADLFTGRFGCGGIIAIKIIYFF